MVDRKWRGIGAIPNSGFGLRDEYQQYDTEYRLKGWVFSELLSKQTIGEIRHYAKKRGLKYKHIARYLRNEISPELLRTIIFPCDWRYAKKEPKPNDFCTKVLLGKMKPNKCPYYKKECSQEHPIGALMVSSEGACAAYFLYNNDKGETK